MIRKAKDKDQARFDKKALHPLQSWAWGEFRKKTGVSLTRLVEIREKKMSTVYQITWHKVPGLGEIGYCPKSSIPSVKVVEAVMFEAKIRGAFMVKWEPMARDSDESAIKIEKLNTNFNFRAGKSLFTKNTFWLDVSKSEKNILAGMNQKTRYNIRLAEKKGVKIVEDVSDTGFEEYWRLTEETTKRQGFFAHTKKYHRLMWEDMVVGGKGTMLKAVYDGKVLGCWVLFVLNGVLYYPYGSSSSLNREVMASNLLMWKAILYGKKYGCHLFDMWGSLGENPDKSDSWYGFHKFKQGYGGELVTFVGTYDLVIFPFKYYLYLVAEVVRGVWLKARAKIRA